MGLIMFHNARSPKYQKGIGVVNQGITSSYNPATPTCITCRREHKVTNTRSEGQPATLIFTDQNFARTLQGDRESFMGIFRVENSSLDE